MFWHLNEMLQILIQNTSSNEIRKLVVLIALSSGAGPLIDIQIVITNDLLYFIRIYRDKSFLENTCHINMSVLEGIYDKIDIHLLTEGFISNFEGKIC